MKLIVGLGNPGEKYKKCRHNTGFILVDKFAGGLDLKWEGNSKFESEVIVGKDYVLAKPQTFMNNSGRAVSKLVNFYKIDLKDLVVVHDDVDLPFGTTKKQFGAGPAGHHGVEDIIEKIASKEFWRIRVGIGKPSDGNIPVEDFVLQDFNEEELKSIMELDVDLG